MRKLTFFISSFRRFILKYCFVYLTVIKFLFLLSSLFDRLFYLVVNYISFTLFSDPLLLQVQYPRRRLPLHINRFLRRVQPPCTHLLWPELQGQYTLLVHQVEHHQAWNRPHEPREQVLYLAGNSPSNFFFNFRNVLTDRQTLYIHAEFRINLVSGKLPTYPSPKSTFWPKREVSVNVGLGEG